MKTIHGLDVLREIAAGQGDSLAIARRMQAAAGRTLTAPLWVGVGAMAGWLKDEGLIRFDEWGYVLTDRGREVLAEIQD